MVDAVAIAKALHTRFHVLPYAAATRELPTKETVEQIMHESLAQCDYRTLPQGVRVYPVADSAVEALQQSSIRERYLAQEATPIGGTPEETAQFMAGERKLWSEVIKRANVKIEGN